MTKIPTLTLRFCLLRITPDQFSRGLTVAMLDFGNRAFGAFEN